MALFNFRRKGGSGKGKVVETHPAHATTAPAAPKKPAFPGTQVRGALNRHAEDFRHRDGGPGNVQKSHDFVDAAEKSHAAERYPEAVGHLESARRAMPAQTTGPFKGEPHRSFTLEQHIEDYKKSVNGLTNKPTAEEDWFHN
jgi:hypothetical protein